MNEKDDGAKFVYLVFMIVVAFCLAALVMKG
jgi:hypothetical protein